MTTNYKINGTDTDDLFARRDLFTEGGLWLWGGNTYGQLGDNSITHRSSPVQTVSGGTNWKQLAIGGGVTVAGIKTDGTLWMWGFNGQGQLGDNTIANRSSPVQTVASGTNWKQVACAAHQVSSHAAAIKTDGTLWTWGFNFYGQLGDNTATNKSSPVQTAASGTNWKQVAATESSTFAIKTDGTMWGWGSADSGLLPDNSVHRSSPVLLYSGTTNWKSVSAGQKHVAAIKSDSTIVTWGNDSNGVLGQGVSGTTGWKQVACGSAHTAAVKTDGTLWSWGANNNGQLGDGTITQSSSPVQTVAGGTNWKQVACGADNFTAAIKTDGTLWTWGLNGSGQLGDNTRTGKSSPIQTISSGTNWKQVSAGINYVAAIREDYWA